MAWLTYKLFLLAATLTSCGLAYVPNSNMKCECTCSPTNNPAKKYSAVGNFEAVFQPKSDSGTTFKTTTEASLEFKVPTVPTLLKDSPFKVQNEPKLDIFNYKDSNMKQATSYEIKKETSVPLVQKYSSRPVTFSSRSTTSGFVSPTSASILPNSPIELKVTPSAFRKAMRTVSNNSTEPKESEPPKDLIDTKRLEEMTKTEALTLDDIIFGKVPFDFGSRGIQRNFLTESETKALKNQKTSTMNASITTKRSTTGTAAPETVANEFTASETAASETSTPVKKSTVNRVQPETSLQPETPTATTQSSTTTIITTTAAPTTLSTTTTATTETTGTPMTVPTTLKTLKPISRRGLLPLFRTGYSPFTPAKTEKPVTVTNAAVPSTESSTKPTTSQPKTTTTSTTQKVTTPSSTTEKPTTKAPTTTTATTKRPTTVTTQKPTSKRRPETQTQSSYNVNPSSPPARTNTMQRKDLPVISANVNPAYRFSDSFRKNTIRNLLDAFKPEYMKTLHEEEATVKPRPKQPQRQQQQQQPQQLYVPAPPAHYNPMMQKELDIPFGHFEKTRSVDVPNHQLVHSMSSLSSMNSLQSSNSRQPALVVLDSPAQEQQHVPYQLHDQHTQQEPSWNPIQEPKKWGEPPKGWAQGNQQQQLQQSLNLQNHQLWNPHQNSIQKTQVFNPSFAMSGQTKQQQQSRQGAFPGLQLNKSPIDFRVH